MNSPAQDTMLTVPGLSALATLAWHLGILTFAHPSPGGAHPLNTISGAYRTTGGSAKKNQEPGDETYPAERG